MNEPQNELINPNSLNGQFAAVSDFLSPEQKAQLEATMTKPETTPQAPQATPTTPPATPTTPTEPVVDEIAEKLKKSSLFGDVITTPVPAAKYEKWEDLAPVLSTELGVSIKDQNELASALPEIKKWKESSAQAEQFKQESEKYVNFFAGLPDDLFQALNEYNEGKDYRSTLKTMYANAIDFDRDFKAHPKKMMVQAFFPGEFPDEDYQEDDQKVEFAYKQAERLYAEKQAAVQSERNAYRTKYTQQQENLAKITKETANKSLASLPQTVSATQRSSIQKMLETGAQSLVSTFLDENGGWKPNAAELLHYALHAKDEIELAKEFIRKRTETATAEQFISRGQDNPSIRGGGTNPGGESAEEAAKKIADSIYKKPQS